MYLKAVEIQGFKSFPTRQYIEFHSGLTAIVGPNGCGKSNVTDAVRWVLGEQSAKSLRGAKMEDVIFNGTSTRKPMSSAEVSIYIDNSDHSLDFDYDTLVVTRRYYRSGESEYLINQKSCRLRDIRELFADTGIGQDGYSIIEQGRVDEILSERSEDRRKVFDEAAGIVKYKMRKREAERKLLRTDDNLQRLEDLSGEMERQLKPLAKQAKEAQIYKMLASEVRDLDIYLSVLAIQEEEHKEKDRVRYYASLLKDITVLEEEKDKLHSERSELLANRKKREIKGDQLNEHFNEKTKSLALLAEEKALAAERERAAKKRIEDIHSELKKTDFSTENLEGKLKQRDDHRLRLVERQSAGKARLAECESELAGLEEKLSSIEREEATRRERLTILQDLIFSNRSQVFALNREFDQGCIRKEELVENLSIEEENLALQVEKKSQIKTALESTALLLSEQEILLKEASLEHEKQIESIGRVEKRISEENQLIQQKDYQLNTLKRLEENREGYHQAVRAISRQIEKNPLFGEGLVGPVAELIVVEEAYELAIETALGGSLHNLVTEDSRAATKFIEWLKDTKEGRETFLPLDRIVSRRLSQSELRRVEGKQGYLGTVDEFMSCREDLSPLLEYLGGRIILADHLASAQAISDAVNKQIKVVTLEGDVVNPGGSMTGGRTSKGLSGLISRSREIDEIEFFLQEHLLIAEQNKKELAEQKALLQERSEYIQKISLKRNEVVEKKRQLEEEKLLHETIIEERKPQLLAVKKEIEILGKRITEISVKKEALSEELLAYEDEKDKISALLSEREQDDTAEKLHREKLREEITELKVSLGSTEEAIKGIEELKKQLLEENRRQGEERLQLEKEEADLKEDLERGIRERHLRDEREKIIQMELKAISSEQANLKKENEAHVNRELMIFERSEQISSQLNSMEAEKERARGRQERYEEKLIREKNRIWEEYHLSFNQARDLVKDLELEDKSMARLKTLKEKLRALPPVNHSAPEDYEKLNARYELMIEQKKDVVNSRKQLTKVIEELESAMRKQFIQELQAINEDFQQCFAQLFSGGKATISPGEGDLLECDIEIKAQPPGKRLQSLSLLSGGERALTAIALVFAIFRQKPAPFCFLDEVDSALDESNVIRFAEFIQAYTDTTQFIVVTHRKGTMEAASRLYGVTMKERGVSSILSLDLSEGSLFASDAGDV